jgi:hypothetical protein
MMATGKLKVSGFSPAILMTIGSLSTMVIKLACSGKISNFPKVFLEETDKASPSKMVFLEERTITFKILGLDIGFILLNWHQLKFLKT